MDAALRVSAVAERRRRQPYGRARRRALHARLDLQLLSLAADIARERCPDRGGLQLQATLAQHARDRGIELTDGRLVVRDRYPGLCGKRDRPFAQQCRLYQRYGFREYTRIRRKHLADRTRCRIDVSG